MAEDSPSVDRTMVMAFVGFFGVGVGLALGAGLVWSLGGFNFARTETAAPVPAQTQPSDTAPGVLQIAFQMRPNPSALVESLDVILPALRNSTAVTMPVSGQPGLLTLPVRTTAPGILTSAPIQPSNAPPSELLTVSPQTPEALELSEVNIALPGIAPSLSASLNRQAGISQPDAERIDQAASVAATPSAPQAVLPVAGLATQNWTSPEGPGTAFARLAPLPDANPATLSLTAPATGANPRWADRNGGHCAGPASSAQH
jgi:hypothetical protein